MRSIFPSALAAILLLAGHNPLKAASEKIKHPTNVVFILIDDLGWRDLGCYGSTFYETPHIDKLATQGMKFTAAYAACSVCSPTRACILTGQYPARLHLTDYLGSRPPKDAKLQVPTWTPYLTRDTPTVAGTLKARGYVTGLIGKWHLGGSREFDAPEEAVDSVPERRGFDVNTAGNHYGQPPDYFAPYERSGPKGTTYRFRISPAAPRAGVSQSTGSSVSVSSTHQIGSPVPGADTIKRSSGEIAGGDSITFNVNGWPRLVRSIVSPNWKTS